MLGNKTENVSTQTKEEKERMAKKNCYDQTHSLYSWAALFSLGSSAAGVAPPTAKVVAAAGMGVAGTISAITKAHINYNQCVKDKIGFKP